MAHSIMEVEGETIKRPTKAEFDLQFFLTDVLKNYNILSFPKELLQNSDDAGCKEVVFVFDVDRGIMYHWQDKPLTAANIAAMGKFYGHTKMCDPTKIGRFGVGFSTVFHVTNFPMAFSNGESWAMDLESLVLGASVPLPTDSGKPPHDRRAVRVSLTHGPSSNLRHDFPRGALRRRV